MQTAKLIQMILTGLLAILASAVMSPRVADAGCGCNKPPPLPATVIPSVAYPGMQITLYDPSLTSGQKWTVTFNNGSQSVPVNGKILYRRDITDSSGRTRDYQLTIAVPNIASGPTKITAVSGSNTINVPNTGFVVMGKPQIVHQQNSEFEEVSYSTGVGADGTLYVAVGGLDKVCDPIDFTSSFANIPLSFGDGDVLIYNWQGYFIDALTPASHNHFSITPATSPSSSDILYYGRHSFQTYCKQHRPGGIKQVDPRDKNWHRDGTPHVDYSAVIFAIKGVSGGTAMPAGPVVPTPSMNLATELPNDGEGQDWEKEPSEPED
ncbi:MAG TPA: hypothetical protein VMT61_14440 [Candidatus Binataceae bacterium]|nr:hypothetical protein [Candidatus Binataceae bacterium]